MAELVVNDLQEGYVRVVNHVLEHGELVAPRGRATREVRGVEIVVTNPQQTLPVGVGRALNSKIAAVEALQLMGGVLHPELLVKATPDFRDFMDGGTFHGGYGTRVRGQLPAVQRRLITDPNTRQAVVVIWDPQHDLHVNDVRDIPCTIALQFVIRHDELELHTHMRSNDVWRGLAYDAFVFSQLQLAMAASLGLTVGDYHHHVVSLHLYDTDRAAVERLTYDLDAPFILDALIKERMTMDGVMQIARRILTLGSTAGWDVVTNMETVMWYAERIRELRTR